MSETGDDIIVDGQAGHGAPAADHDMIQVYVDKVRLTAKRRAHYLELKDKPAVTRDGVDITLLHNSGLVADLPMLDDTGAAGVGLFRTELQFMIASKLPRLQEQVALYSEAIRLTDGKPIVFRLLDIGGDKVIPYLRSEAEENPAMGFRSLRLALDRQGLLRIQIRALLKAANGGPMKILVPMVTDAWEFRQTRLVVNKELERMKHAGQTVPSKLELGAMIEVPSLLWELDQVLPEADFVSIGSNDLVMFLTAADRGNKRVAKAYDPIALPRLRALKHIVDMARRYDVPLTMCGELAGKTVEALALLSIGMTQLSMSPPSIGPIKEMILGLDLAPDPRLGFGCPAAKGPSALVSATCCSTGPAARAFRSRYSRTSWPRFPRTSSTLLTSASTASRRRCRRGRRPSSSSSSARNMPSSSRWCARSTPTRSSSATLRPAEDLLSSGDKEMAEMADAEIDELKPKIEQAIADIRILLLPKDAADEKSVILEVRGGTGGDEAALFAGDLLRMYQRYAELTAGSSR